MRACEAIVLIAVVACWPAPAAAQAEILGVDAFDGQIDLRASAVGGETSWSDGGFGKLRAGGRDGDTRARLRVASVDLAWKPEFSWNLSGLVSVTRQQGQSNDFDINEAFLKFRSAPEKVRFSARVGMFWPPISLEHGGSNWTVTDSITPSAANSWVSEEVKVLGIETKVQSQLGAHEVSLTGALFLHNDMAGTLLSYRGWALHDFRVTMRSDLPLPPLSASTAPYQDKITSPFWEVDDRVGYYARADWRPPLPFAVNLFHYDNRGDRTSSRRLQTSWHTRFWNLGATAALGERTVAKSQILWGNTLVGPDTPLGVPVNVDFVTAYVLLGRELGRGKVSLRADWFKTHDNTFVASDNNNEDGWAAMAAYKRPVARFADVVFELLHVSSERPARVSNAGIRARQDQTIAQTSVRLGF
jgi:hypothetical protein